LFAPAKINIGLIVKERLASGYHKIETIMVPIKLFDTLIIKRKKSGIYFKSDSKKIPSDRNNLVIKAANLFFNETKIKGGIEIFLKKKIPISAGLGGGSSDAAQTLLGLNQIYGKPLSITQLHELAMKIGMDVPFFLYRKPCIATGCGEKLKFIKIPKLFVVLFSPNFGVSTKWAYENIDKGAGLTPHPLTKRVSKQHKVLEGTSHNQTIGAGLTDSKFSLKILIKKLINNDLNNINAFVVNSFESLVFSKYPELLTIKNKFLAYGAYGASLSGSGSSIFGLVNRDKMTILKRNLPKDYIKVLFIESSSA
jgi:4-diphosphocytidyl-2-C-methyl-D-erythritol kinase